VAEAFVRLRIEAPALGFGASTAAVDAAAIIERAMPAV
jgi:hypothetical protein